MSIASVPRTWTTSELESLPDTGTRRELIRGELREQPLTRRNRSHSRIEIRLGRFLDEWLDTQPQPRGLIVGGEAGFRLATNPDTLVGIDVAYVSAEVVARSLGVSYFEGPPILAVEILSPSDTQDEIDEKVELYLNLGVSLVWLVHPRLRAIVAHRPDAPPQAFGLGHDLTAEPHLPGFRVPVSLLFDS